ncbi:MAG: hypothetical protein KKB59_12495, partial [Spirochaetes bacterium]|nr:hypothetical protein [Spirochaetota bacterium]
MTTSRRYSGSETLEQPRHSLRGPIVLALAAALCAATPSSADTAARDAALCASLSSGAEEALSLGYTDAAVLLLDEAL